jgi:oligosaccharide repeat unit polymerase
MTFLIIVCLALLLAVDYYFFPSALSPSVLFTGVWLVNVVLLSLAGDSVYAVRPETLTVFLGGALAFAVGSFISRVVHLIEPFRPFVAPASHLKFMHKLLAGCLFICLFGFPFFLYKIFHMASGMDAPLLYAIRASSVEAEQGLGIGPLANLVGLSAMTAQALLFVGSYEHRYRTATAVFVALVYGIFTGSKGGSIQLVVVLSFTALIRAGYVHKKALAAAVAAVTTSIAFGFLAVNLALEKFAGYQSSFRLLLESIGLFYLSPLTAFDSIVVDTNRIESVHHWSRSIKQFLNNFGFSYDIPSIHAAYTYAAPGYSTNTYTIYFTYYKDYGWIGVLLFTGLLGFGLTWLFTKAWRGEPLAALLYAFGAFGILMSFNAEYFFLAFNPWLKAVLFFGLIFYCPPFKLAPWKILADWKKKRPDP